MCKRPSIRRFLRQRLQYINKWEQDARGLRSPDLHRGPLNYGSSVLLPELHRVKKNPPTSEVEGNSQQENTMKCSGPSLRQCLQQRNSVLSRDDDEQVGQGPLLVELGFCWRQSSG